jgi:hypothetical protein
VTTRVKKLIHFVTVLTQAEEDLVEHAKFRETEEEDTARDHQGAFNSLSFPLLVLSLASLQDWKPTILLERVRHLTGWYTYAVIKFS